MVRRLRIVMPIAAKPSSIIAQVAGSGTAAKFNSYPSDAGDPLIDLVAFEECPARVEILPGSPRIL